MLQLASFLLALPDRLPDSKPGKEESLSTKCGSPCRPTLTAIQAETQEGSQQRHCHRMKFLRCRA